MTDRMIVEAHGLGRCIAARMAGVRYVAMGGVKPSKAASQGIPMAVASRSSAREAAGRMRPGQCLLCASYASPADVPEELHHPGVFAYIDRPACENKKAPTH